MPNNRVCKYMYQRLTEMKGEIESNRIIIGDFKIPFPIMDRKPREKINKKKEDRNNSIDKWF